jgi:hypothetical protein
MLHKCFLQTQFGTPHEWTEQYFDNFRRLESTGWSLKVFTPNPWKSQGNIEIIPMTLAEFDGLVEQKCGVNPRNFLKGPAPSKVISDYYCAFGHIFEDFLSGVDYWGFSNWDCTYGRLSKFLPDKELVKYEVWADEGSVAINGIFSLFHNDRYRVNRLYQHVPDWKQCFATHEPCGFDEIRMTHALRKLVADREVIFGHPDHFPLHSYDRLPQHMPTPKVYFEPDGALIERYDDQVHFPNERGFFGREIMFFHWNRTKRWPIAA